MPRPAAARIACPAPVFGLIERKRCASGPGRADFAMGDVGASRFERAAQITCSGARHATFATAAFIVILAPIYAEFGMAGLLMSGLLAGGMLMLMAAVRLGSWIQFIPHPVTTGFTAGVGAVIAVLQHKDFRFVRDGESGALRRARASNVCGARRGEPD